MPVPAQNQQYENFIIRYKQNTHGGFDYESDETFQIVNDLFGILYVPMQEVPELELSSYSYSSIPRCYTYMDTGALSTSGVTRLHNHPYLKLQGKGTLVAVIDSGIDYLHPAFHNGVQSKIFSIWDQTLEGGADGRIPFGREFGRQQIEQALASENPWEIVPSSDTNGHGTRSAATAAGYRIEKDNFCGAAPEAEIVIVKLKQAKRYLTESFFVPDGVTAYEENDVIAAVKYLEGYAVSMRRPLVICMGIGTNMGNHEGQSLLAEYLNSVATRRSRSVVVCGGDEGNSAHHFIGYATAGMKQSTENVEIRVDAGEKGFVAELWGTMPGTHAISIRAPGGEITDPVDFKVQETREFTFIYEKTVIRVDHSLVEPGSGGELILFRFQDPTPGIWTIQVTTTGAEYDENGNFHIWLPITQFMGGNTYFLRPSPYVTLTEPGNTREVITTTYYQDSNNSFYGESGRGFSRRGNIKPELCTPGVEISTVLGSRTGSAFGAALLAGICAQFLQWAVVDGRERWLESREVKNYLIRGAVRPPGIQFPSREWGYGQVNIAKTFDVIAGI